MGGRINREGKVEQSTLFYLMHSKGMGVREREEGGKRTGEGEG